MTTINDEELRLEMESLSVCSDYRGLMSAKVIELLDRIDSLEAMYLKLNQHCGALERENEAKDRLLERSFLSLHNAQVARGSAQSTQLMDDITKHLKGTP